MGLHERGRGGGFALVEASAIIALGAAACCLGAVAARQNHLNGGLAGSIANLKKIGEATGSYAADFDDQLWSFTWGVGEDQSRFEDLWNPSTPALAIAYQATDIVRRRFDESIPRLEDRLAAPFLSTLVLVDYLDESLPAEWAVSPGDAIRLEWQADPHNPPELNEQGGAAWDAIYGPFGSSYQLMPAFVGADQRDGNNEVLRQYAPHHDLYLVPPSVVFGGRRVGEIGFPAGKVHMAERASYFFGPRPVYFLHQEARVPVLMADGSVSPRTSRDANLSFNPNYPDSPYYVSVADYSPNTMHEPPTLGGGPRDPSLETHYKWTRRGLRGVDFNGERAE